jgi:hypothetical protein
VSRLLVPLLSLLLACSSSGDKLDKKPGAMPDAGTEAPDARP